MNWCQDEGTQLLWWGYDCLNPHGSCQECVLLGQAPHTLMPLLQIWFPVPQPLGSVGTLSGKGSGFWQSWCIKKPPKIFFFSVTRYNIKKTGSTTTNLLPSVKDSERGKGNIYSHLEMKAIPKCLFKRKEELSCHRRWGTVQEIEATFKKHWASTHLSFPFSNLSQKLRTLASGLNITSW